MFRIFNARERPDPVLLFIVDDTGTYPIDKTYRDMGLSEKWLEFCHYDRDFRNRLCYYYELVPLINPENPPV